jgi:hypothetical protein
LQPPFIKLNKTQLLFLVILIEGYVVLACELLAIRELIPFVGSGTETISIVISAVLLPLAIGYHRGGQAFKHSYHKARRKSRKRLSVRKLLLKNILSSLVILTLGLSYVFMEIFFSVLDATGIRHRLLQTPIYSALFLVTPVYLLGQTVPLISNYFSRRKLSEITGRMLFFSTTGSFLGSVFSTIVLMTFIGVHNTVIVTLGLLCLLCILLADRKFNYEIVCCAFIFGLLFLMNNNATMRAFGIVSNNAYNMASLVPIKDDEAMILNLNRSASSKLSKDPSKNFKYWKYIQEHFIVPISDEKNPPRDILILGAGGFTLGLNDKHNHYIFVDIDKALKEVSEKYFLPEKLSANKHFEVSSARAFLRHHDGRYDLIVLDLFTNIIAIPAESTTQDFLLDVKKLLKPDGIVIANIVMSPAFRDKFSVRYNNTFASVFPSYTRQVMDDFAPWPGTPVKKDGPKAIQQGMSNILYIYYNNPLTEDRTIYTDDKNTYSLDRN